MTISFEPEPWRGLPAEVADLIEPELEAIAAETIEAIAAEVPEYARPLEGRFGRGVRTGVHEALRRFVSLVREPGAGRDSGREVYVALGRGEFRQGRTLDSLQAAYRVGARVAWRRISAAGRAAGLDPEVLSLLAESIFAYIDELSADSVEGYAEARAEVEDVRRRRRRELALLLLGEQQGSAEELKAAAETAVWSLPRRLAAIACREGELANLAGRVPAEALAAVVDGAGCVLVGDPDGPGRWEQIARAVARVGCGVGPPVALAEAPGSWSLALAALRAAESGAIGSGDGRVVAEEHLPELLLLGGASIVARIEARRLAALETLTERAAARMGETALAFVRNGGNAVAMARELHVHPQTVRYRVAKLRELLGEQLDDPDARFELELALRARSLSGAASAAGS